MGKRTVAASTAAVSALFLAVLPVSANTEYALTPTTMDWRLVVVFSLLGVLAFHFALELVKIGAAEPRHGLAARGAVSSPT